MDNKSPKKKVIKGCDIEGRILEEARKAKKNTDGRYTQQFVAELVGQSQNIWTQWQTGTTRILDLYWIKFSLALDFNPFKTRPELLDLAQLILQAESKYVGENYDKQFDLMYQHLDDADKEMILGLISKISAK